MSIQDEAGPGWTGWHPGIDPTPSDPPRWLVESVYKATAKLGVSEVARREMAEAVWRDLRRVSTLHAVEFNPRVKGPHTLTDWPTARGRWGWLVMVETKEER